MASVVDLGDDDGVVAVRLPAEYFTAGQEVVEVQIAKGGVRLADVLNRILGE